MKRTIYVKDNDLWEAVKIKAEGRTISKVVVQLLKMWLIGLIKIDWKLK